ncbi:MAG: carboxypeptidase-like regulatory domain-containing protein [Lewinella sp.]|nr:carboxypeptidase-like regulatory domain-containing protein [Lewinella sp.]
MYKFLAFLGLCVVGAGLPAQSFSGRVTSQETGEGLPYASIFVPETGSGTVTNEEGDFYVKLPNAGDFTLVFQYLSYNTVVKNLRAGGDQVLNISLSSKALQLQEVLVLDGKEDPSYSVIRRAIAKADYHRNQVDAYQAKVYVKGTGKINKVPSLMLRMMGKEERKALNLDQAYIAESISKVSYRRPNTFRQEVISKYERGELSGGDATPYLFATFYQAEVAGAISPLSTKAFGYYRFSHEGLFMDRGRFVNKIKVTPRSQGENVFSGYLYIVDKEWSLHQVDLQVFKLGFSFAIHQTYAPIQEKVWMPLATTVDVTGGILGVKLEIHYVSTVSDYNITINPDLPTYVEVIDAKSEPDKASAVKKQNSNRSAEQKLAEGGELTNKELRRLVQNYERQEAKAQDQPAVVNDFTMVEHSAETVRDTALWASLRPVPLTELEKKSYLITDSLAAREMTEPKSDKKRGGPPAAS